MHVREHASTCKPGRTRSWSNARRFGRSSRVRHTDRHRVPGVKQSGEDGHLESSARAHLVPVGPTIVPRVVIFLHLQWAQGARGMRLYIALPALACHGFFRHPARPRSHTGTFRRLFGALSRAAAAAASRSVARPPAAAACRSSAVDRSRAAARHLLRPLGRTHYYSRNAHFGTGARSNSFVASGGARGACSHGHACAGGRFCGSRRKRGVWCRFSKCGSSGKRDSGLPNAPATYRQLPPSKKASSRGIARVHAQTASVCSHMHP